MERADAALSKKYEETLEATSLLIPFDMKAAKIYAELRIDRWLGAPDAIQLACAAAAGVDLFITNDTRLQTKQITGIHFIVSLERTPL
jgi:predicted nucleic acid-binding protein